MESKTYTAKEYKLVSLRDCTLTEKTRMCDTPEKAADYWREHIVSCPYFNAECECFVAVLLNTRRHVKGHQLISIGTLDTILVHPREVFRVAIVAGAAAVVVMHNLCAAVHKLCYVERPFMCSHRLAGLASPRVPQREEWL
jgi:DNA repair protein RadC